MRKLKSFLIIWTNQSKVILMSLVNDLEHFKLNTCEHSISSSLSGQYGVTLVIFSDIVPITIGPASNECAVTTFLFVHVVYAEAVVTKRWPTAWSMPDSFLRIKTWELKLWVNWEQQCLIIWIPTISRYPWNRGITSTDSASWWFHNSHSWPLIVT